MTVYFELLKETLSVIFTSVLATLVINILLHKKLMVYTWIDCFLPFMLWELSLFFGWRKKKCKTECLTEKVQL